jgi:hypothetical protein
VISSKQTYKSKIPLRLVAERFCFANEKARERKPRVNQCSTAAVTYAVILLLFRYSEVVFFIICEVEDSAGRKLHNVSYLDVLILEIAV